MFNGERDLTLFYYHPWFQAIKKHYRSSYYDGATFDVVSVDTQSSSGGGILIMVIGFLTGKDNLKRKFSQAFYLARQNRNYVVSNDVHRFVDEEGMFAKSCPQVTKPVEKIKKTGQVHKATKKKSVNAAEVKKVVAPEKAVVTAPKPKEPVAETSAAPPLVGAKISYASIVSFILANLTLFYLGHL